MYPTAFEGVDDAGDLLFTVKCFDEVASTVEIKRVVGLDEWRRIADLIQQALNQMHGEHV